MALALDSLTFDCADVMRVARFWSDALGWELDPESEPDGARVVRSRSGRSDSLYFQPVPESKVVKNRLHLDLRASPSRWQPRSNDWRGSAPPSWGVSTRRAASGP